jgi:GMP synthase (glutamine-hydrolysing)
MAKVVVIQHHPVETLGTIADALAASGLACQYVRTFEGHPVPKELNGVGGLIVMGGPMGVYETERYPYLRDEMALVESALSRNKPLLGVCLGSQLLASVLGARVAPSGGKELGWHRVSLTPAAVEDRLFRGVPDSFVAFHWHGDIFELPSGAVTLASSDKTACQAFRYGDRAYGLLCHLEVNERLVAGMVEAFRSELEDEKIDAEELITATPKQLAQLAPIAETVFERWAELVPGI